MARTSVLLAALTCAIFPASFALPHDDGPPPALTHALHGQYHNASWPGFIDATTRWDAYASPTFNYVFIPETEQDVAHAVKHLSRSKTPFLLKSGGHGYSVTLDYIQNGTFINMQNFNYSRVNDDGTMTFGAAQQFEDMIEAQANAGREMTLGSCPCVGGTGAMLGGGIGRYQGLYGLTSDAVRKIRMVLYNGTIVEASTTTNSDLYWGMRGAGQNFGVVIETTYETYPLANNGQNYQADMVFTLGNASNMIDTVNSLLPLPAPLSVIPTVVTDPTTLEQVIAVNLVYVGPEDEGRKYTEKFAPFSSTIEESIIPTKELLVKSAGGAATLKCAPGQNHIMFGTVVESVDPTSFVDMVQSYSDFIHQYPAANQSGLLIEVFAQQGINAYPADYDAFPHRGTFNVMMEWEVAFYDESIAVPGHAWAKGWRDHFSAPAIGRYDPPVTYQNYAHGDEPLPQLYGFDKWRQEKLTALKQQYDPYGSFNAYHAVPSTAAGWSEPQIGYENN